ncbi:polysaccharide deacetylase family protein [Bacillus sp. 1P06AnD]|uniref:polysaccharide deacetylase family protein n=1 Tax=Bacillus sp. 1P06AnD TaxID=3132208 RepID=UPI0039A3D631
MKKSLTVLVSLLVLLSIFTVTHHPVKAQKQKVASMELKDGSNSVTINGQPRQWESTGKLKTMTKNKKMYAPARLLVDEWGYKSVWNKGVFSFSRGNVQITFNTKKRKMYINHSIVSSFQSFTNQGRLYLPVDLLAKGLNQQFYQDGKLVYIGSASFINEKKQIKERSTKIPVIMYHHFDPAVQSGTIVDPAVFKQQMMILKNQGYTTITADEAIAIAQKRIPMPEKPIMITMDDGYESNYTYAYPILKELNMKATLFMVTDFIEHPRSHPSPYPKLTWAQLKDMSDSGVFSIQSHTDNMHQQINGKGLIASPISKGGKRETQSQYEQRIYDDVVRSKRLLEKHLGKPVTVFAYPFGQYSTVSEKMLRKAGFHMTVTTDRGLLDISKKNPTFLIKRVNIHGKATAASITQTIEKMYHIN